MKQLLLTISIFSILSAPILACKGVKDCPRCHKSKEKKHCKEKNCKHGHGKKENHQCPTKKKH